MTQVNRELDVISTLKMLNKRVSSLERTSKYDDESASDVPPIPPNVYLQFHITETKTHAEYGAVVKWDTVSPNTCQADVDSWAVELRAVNASGVAADSSDPFPDGKSVQLKYQKHVDNKGQTDPHFNHDKIERPNTWYYQARVRIKDKAHRLGDWSSWTSPQIPSAASDQQPPTPTNVTLGYDTIEKTRHDRIRAIVGWDEITGFDIAGGDHESDVAFYTIQLRPCDAGGTALTTDYRTRTVSAIKNDAGAGSRNTVAFEKHISKFTYYQARARCVDRFNRRSVFSSWTTPSLPVDNTAPAVPQNAVVAGEHNEVNIEWDNPTSASDTEIVNTDVAYYQVQVATNSSFSNIVRFAEMVNDNRVKYRTDKYKQRYFLRVRSVDDSGNKSAWRPTSGQGPAYPRKVAGSRRVVAGVGTTSEIDYLNESGVPLAGSQTNRVYLSSNTGNAVLTADAEVTGDVLVEAIVKTSDTLDFTHLGVIFKGGSSNNFLMVDLQSAGGGGTGVNLTIKKRVSGTFTTLYGPATGCDYGDEVYLGIKYVASTGGIFIDRNHLGFPGTANYTLTAGEKTAFGTNTLAGFYIDRGATGGTNDDGHSRVDSITVTDNTSLTTTLVDDFDRASSSSVIGTSDSGHTWTSNVGTWGISSDAIPSAILGFGFILPMFYAEDTNERLRTWTTGVATKMGEGGLNTPAMTIAVSQPTRFLCWASANLLLNETAGSDVNVKLQIGVDDGSGINLGLSGQQSAQTNDYANNKRRYIANQRDYFITASPTAPVTLDFYWVWTHAAGSNKSYAVNTQKLSVIASYAPDYAPAGVTNPGSRWTSNQKNLTRYKVAETNA